MCKIVVIDTGIDIENTFLSMKCAHGICIKKQFENGEYSIVSTEQDRTCIQDNIGHGTAVCGIILSHNPEAEIFVVKLFDWDSLHAD